MPDEKPLSMADAVAFMTAAPPPADAGTSAAPKEPETPAPASTPAPAPAAQGTNTSPAADDPQAGNDAAAPPAAPAAGTTPPAQGDAPATADGQADPGSLPPIEPPSSWKAEHKELFKTLPRAAQEEVARLEQARSTEVRNLQNAAAEQRKQAEGEVAKLTELAQRVDTVLNAQVAEIAREFPEIKTPADLAALAANDPARYNLLQAKLVRFNSDKQEADNAKAVIAAEQQRRANETLSASRNKLLELFPTWSDTGVLRTEMTAIQDYAISQGLSEGEARQAIHPILYHIANKAMLYDRAQAALAAGRNRTPAPVVTPGTSSSTPRQDKASADRAAGMRKLTQTGDIMDAVSLMLAK